jgi:NAD(P)-dependent dehydrogenase (short-subunit alcohol dehydrogenase family)
MELDGKEALVTGGASGIGAATARLLAERGCAVTVADVQDALGEEVAAEIGGTYIHLDVSDPVAWGAVGPFDIAHLNAGIVTPSFDVLSVSDADYRRIMGINVDGVVFGVRALGSQMADGGAIVATASMAGLIAYGLDPIYNLTKHAVVGFVRGAALQLQPKGITLNCVCPGVVDTPLIGEGRAVLEAAGFPLIPASQVAEAVVDAITGGRTGEAWMVLLGGNEVHSFPEFGQKLSGGRQLPSFTDAISQ